MFLDTHLRLLLAYYQAVQTLRNKVYAISNSEVTVQINGKAVTLPKRSASVGFAQYSLFIMSGTDAKHFVPKRLFLRHEKNFFNGKLSIISNKIRGLFDSDILSFGDDQTLYISKEHWWLDDPKYYKLIKVDGRFGAFACYEYDVAQLMADKKVIGLTRLDRENKVVAFTGKYLLDDDCDRQYFDYHLYDKEVTMLHKLFVQNDPRQAAVVYYGFIDDRYTSHFATIPALACDLAQMTGIDETVIRRKLYRCKKKTVETGLAHPTFFQLTQEQYDVAYNCLKFDTSCLDEDYRLGIVISNEKNFDIFSNKKVKKTEDLAEYHDNYQKENGTHLNKYKKVIQWLKRNPNKATYPRSWDAECLEIAKQYLLKHSV